MLDGLREYRLRRAEELTAPGTRATDGFPHFSRHVPLKSLASKR